MDPVSRLGLVLLAGLAPSLLRAGPEPLLPLPGEPEPFLVPSLDLRVRYEFREVEPFDEANALTARARLGLLTRETSGFSLFGELESTLPLVADYRSNPADDSTFPHVAGNTVIADPENFELNQAWVRYRNSGFLAKLGRQHLVRNNGAFVGDTTWRQNLQTFDAIDLEYERGAWWFGYVYSDRVLRTFGAGANDAPPGAPLRDLEGDFHFLDALYNGDGFTTGYYAYHLDVDNSPTSGRTNSFGAYLERSPLRAEVAFQDGQSSLAPGDGDYGAWYAHVHLNQAVGETQLQAGMEFLQDNFRMPAGRLHAFNGFADAFVIERSGFGDAGGAYEGLNDLYLGGVRPGLPGDVTGKAFFHWFFDDQFGESYGYEFDVAVEKKINQYLSALLTGAWFSADEGNGFSDIQQVTFELTLKF